MTRYELLEFAQQWDMVDDCLRDWWKKNQKDNDFEYESFKINVHYNTMLIITIDFDETVEIPLHFEDFLKYYNEWRK